MGKASASYIRGVADMKVSVLNKRDKALSALVYAMAEISSWNIIFKGGTMLKMCVFNEYRYSEDIDITYVGNLEYEIDTIIREICAIAEPIFGDYLTLVTTDNDRRFRRYINYGNNKRDLIKFEGADILGENHAPPTKNWSLIDRWNIHPEKLEIKGFTLESVMKDKFSCIGRRGEGRDLYDIDSIISETDVDIAESWGLYLDGWNSKTTEWGDRAHPSDLATAMMSTKRDLLATWEESVAENLFVEKVSFDEAFDNVHQLIEELVAKTF